jgi:hypothetical protein
VDWSGKPGKVGQRLGAVFLTGRGMPAGAYPRAATEATAIRKTGYGAAYGAMNSVWQVRSSLPSRLVPVRVATAVPRPAAVSL